MSLSPEQFNKLATKQDIESLDEKMDHIKDGVGKLLTVADGLAKKVDDIEHAFVTNMAAHDRFEKRITRIEKELKLQPLFN